MTKMREWMRLATREEREQLAELSGTTVGNLQQIAGGWRVNPKLGFFLRLHFGMRLMQLRNPSLPVAGIADLARPEDLPTKATLRKLGDKHISLS